MKSNTRFLPIAVFSLLALVLYSAQSVARNVAGEGSEFKSSLSFLKNAGQVADQYGKPRNDIDGKLETGNGLNIYIGAGQLHYQWFRATKTETTKNKSPRETTDMYRLDVELIGANKNAKAIFAGKQAYYERYFLPHLKGITVESYSKIIYQNIYPNIDWILYVNNNAEKVFKYDFIVREGGNPADIRLQYKGASSIQLKDGTCFVTTPLGTITEQTPYCYVAGSKQEVKSNFILNNDMLSFNIGSYDGELVIDPFLNWSTYYGNLRTIPGKRIAADSLGNAYLCGETAANNNIATTGTHKYNNTGGTADCFIVKFDKNGYRQWGSFYGGTDYDLLTNAAVDADNNLYITGTTYSTTGIGTTGAHQTVNNGDPNNGHSLQEAFLAKFTPDGQLSWGTFYGGLYIDNGLAVAPDNFGSVYLTGYTNSIDSIATPGAFQTSANKGFIVKFNANTGQRVWGTFFNGQVNAIKCLSDTNFYIAGTTNIYTNVSSTGSYQATHGGGVNDGFLVKFRPNGTRIWGTYYGSTADEEVFAVSADMFNAAYIGVGNRIVKFNSSGAYQWVLTYPSLPSYASITSMTSSPDGCQYFSSNYFMVFSPVSYSHFGKVTRTGVSKWLVQVGLDTMRTPSVAYTYSKYYYGGTTLNTIGFATTNPNTFQTISKADSLTAYLRSYEADTSVYIVHPFTDTSFCAGDSLWLKYKTTNDFRGASNSFYVELSDSFGNFTAPVIIGSKTAYVGGILGCRIPPGTFQSKNYKIRIRATAPADTFYYPEISTKIWRYFVPIAVSNSPLCENTNLSLDDAATLYAPDYVWTGPGGFNYPSVHNAFRNNIQMAQAGDYIVETNNNGCKARDTITVQVEQSPEAGVIAGDTSLCLGDSLYLTATCATSGVFFQWQNPVGTGPQSPDFKILSPGFSDAGMYRVTPITSLAYCPGKADTVFVDIHPVPSLTVSNNTPICEKSTIQLNATDTMQNVTYAWVGPLSFSSNAKDVSITNSPVAASGTYLVVTTSPFGCKDTATTTVVVKPLPIPVDAGNNSPLCTGGSIQLTATNSSPTATYSWVGNGFTATSQNTSVQASLPGTFTYTVTVNLNGCTLSDTTTVTVIKTPEKPDAASSPNPIYVGQNLQLDVKNIETGVTYLWTGPDNYSSTNPANNIRPNSVVTMSGKYIVVATIGMCNTADTVVVDIKSQPEQEGKSLFIKPNPNDGIFQLLITANSDNDIPLNIYTTDGKLVHTEVLKPVNKKVDQPIDIRGKISSGIYRLKLLIDGKKETYSIVVR